MKSILYVILLGCAVRCDVDLNNDILQTSDEDFQLRAVRQPLKVYWNVPTGKKCSFKNLYEKYGIIQNSNDTFSGDQITILYDPGSFPALLENSTTGQLMIRNGGVPQEGSWDLHELEFRRFLDESIPNPVFGGIAIIDFESWRPVFRQNFGKLSPYKDYSYKVERRKYPLWPSSWIENAAKKNFESSARRFMEGTLELAKKLRPKALWGYYGFPYCFNMQNSPLVARCSDGVPQENDKINWLWKGSTALFPSVYSSKSLTSYELSQLVEYRVKEAARVRKNEAPILPYFWFRYRDGGFLKKADLTSFLKTIYNSASTGFVIWGSYKDVNDPEKCANLLQYLENTMGPAISKYTKLTTQDDEDLYTSFEVKSETVSNEIDVSSDSHVNKNKTAVENTFETVTHKVTEHPAVLLAEDNEVETSKDRTDKNVESQNEISNRPKQLKVYWNVPSGKKCTVFKELYEKYGIIQNTNDTFEGDKITILYDPGAFPSLMKSKEGNITIFENGGLPQEGSWDIHEMEFKKKLDQKIPDPDFDGVAIIDFEKWRPIFRQHWGSISSVKDYSYNIEKQRYPHWSDTKVQNEAEKSFESSARFFMETTLVMAKTLRPRALWGYYGFPYCFNMGKDLEPDCSNKTKKENDQLNWLWDESTVLTPSVYSSGNLTSDQLSQLVEYRMREAARVRKNKAPILAYFWYRYRDGGFLKEQDLATFLKTIYKSPADGIIIWGAWEDINSQSKCADLFEYLETILGPAVAKYTKITQEDNLDNDSSNEINHSIKSHNNGTSDIRIAKVRQEVGETTKNLVDEKVENQVEITNRSKPLKVYWNVQSGKICSDFKDILYKKYGIIQNTNDTFEGDKITILYNPGSFPSMTKSQEGKEISNGGVPQEGSWGVHEEEFKKILIKKIPNPDFDGVAIIDFQNWRPIFRQHWGSISSVIDYSYEIEEKKHPDWDQSERMNEAVKRFESSARFFLEKTLVMAKTLRPRARWGYYDFPLCFNMGNDLEPDCSYQVKEENDGLNWLWNESTVLVPSVYSSKNLTSDQLSQLVEYRMREAARVRKNEAPILAYFRYRYGDGRFLKEEDLAILLKTIYNSPADGFIIWGPWKDVNSPSKCADLYEYLETTLGPAIAKYTKIKQEDNLDNDIVDTESQLYEASVLVKENSTEKNKSVLDLLYEFWETSVNNKAENTKPTLESMEKSDNGTVETGVGTFDSFSENAVINTTELENSVEAQSLTSLSMNESTNNYALQNNTELKTEHINVENNNFKNYINDNETATDDVNNAIDLVRSSTPTNEIPNAINGKFPATSESANDEENNLWNIFNTTPTNDATNDTSDVIKNNVITNE